MMNRSSAIFGSLASKINTVLQKLLEKIYIKYKSKNLKSQSVYALERKFTDDGWKTSDTGGNHALFLKMP